MRIYFVRHSETEGNRRHLFYGSLDLPITEYGKTQAKRVGELLENVKFDKVYQSPMLRVDQTVDVVLGENRYAKQSMPERMKIEEIRELDFGLWEGLTYNEIREKFPDTVDVWIKDWEHSRPDGGEPFHHFYEGRVPAGFARIMEDAKANHLENGTIMIAAHNGPLQAIFAVAILGLPMRNIWNFEFEQEAYSCIDFEYDNYTIRRINSTEKAKMEEGFNDFRADLE